MEIQELALMGKPEQVQAPKRSLSIRGSPLHSAIPGQKKGTYAAPDQEKPENPLPLILPACAGARRDSEPPSNSEIPLQSPS